MYRAIFGALIFALAACQGEPPATEENQFERIVEAAEIAGSEPLMVTACFENPDCRDPAYALFEAAKLKLKNVELGACRWSANDDGEYITVTLGEADQTKEGLSLEDWKSLGPEKTKDLMGETTLIKPYRYKCNYNDRSGDFQRGYAILDHAKSKGSHDAASMQGLLHMSDPDLFDLHKARSILESCHAYGGGYCAFNLARLESLTSEDGCGRCLSLLRIADRRTEDKRVRFVYALAKRKLGRGEISGPVFFDLEADKGTQAYLSEFDDLFPRLAAKNP